ncbi:MAG: putative glycoside hydrolase [Candidatus Paceibacterota bacterium]|jgi:hypothetical protein
MTPKNNSQPKIRKHMTLKYILISGFFILIFGVFIFLNLSKLYPVNYEVKDVSQTIDEQEVKIDEVVIDEKPPMTHIKTPEAVKAIYMSSWVASDRTFRNKLIKIADETEINSLVIDIKDYTGMISFNVTDPYLKEIGSSKDRIKNIWEFISELHQKNIYVIGRIAVFQDPYFIKKRPDLAVKKKTDKTLVWKDRKGISWIDAGSEDMWDYTVAIAKEAYAVGFDEINFDYIRFPTDGDMQNIYFPVSNGLSKSEVMKNFFSYLREKLKDTGIPMSADVFGLVATSQDDLNIGQVLENTLPYFDYVSPMVYPSHYPRGWNGYKNPASKPYEIIKFAMDKAVERAKVMGENPLKMRPWIQDFNLGATYTPEMIRLEKKAIYDSGLNSFMIWDPGNTYTIGALDSQ